MTYEELLDKWLRKLGRPCTAGEIVHDLRHLERPVRCKDCAHRGWEMECPIEDRMEDDFFCAWGEREDDGETD